MADSRLTIAPVAVAAALALALLGCQNSAILAEARAKQASDDSKQNPFEGGAWGRYRSARFALSIALPDGKAWRIDDRSSSFLRARHDATRSLLRARSWYEPRPVSREACLEGAHNLDPSLTAPGALLEDRLQLLDGELSARLQVGIDRQEGGGLRGKLLLFGVSIRRCFVLAFETGAEGAGAEEIIAERLAIATEQIVQGVRFEGGVEGVRGRE